MRVFDIFKKKATVQPATNNSVKSEKMAMQAQDDRATELSAHSKEPKHIVRGKLSNNKIHLGSYILNPGDREDCYLIFEDERWYIQSEALWPVHRGASNGGQSKNALDTGYLIFNNIFTLEDLLLNIYRGNLKPCREQLQAHPEVLMLLDELVKAKTAPNYIADGISLLWDYDKQHDGIVIHKCFSMNIDVIEIPEIIENYPVVAFGHRAFVDIPCSKLILPSTINELNGISGCKNITEITIPDSTEKCCAFLGCVSLENIYVSDRNKNFCSIDGVLYTRDLKTIVRCPEGKTGTIIMSDETTNLDSWSFANCQHLTAISFSNVLAKIGMDAFKNCKNITELILPDSIDSISWGAFANIERNKIVCKEGSYAHDYLEKNFSNPYWHGKY